MAATLADTIDPGLVPGPLQRLFTEELRDQLVTLRRTLHQHPELSGRETDTATRLAGALAAATARRGATIQRLGAGNIVIGRIAGKRAGAPVVAVRGDIDALPIQEETGLPFASQVPGVMHACGHDVHATWAVGAGALLAASPAAGDVLIVLQPAEETGSGALDVLETGALDGVAAIFGGHVDRRFTVGQIVADEGPLAASADTFSIELVGRGAHAARPHESADPIVGTGALIGALQTIVSRRLNPASSAVVTIGTVNAGTATNIIPERAVITGTLRAIDPSTRRLLREEVERIATTTAATYRLDARVTMGVGTPPVINPPQPTAWAREAVTSMLGRSALVPLGFLNLAGEDFAHYQERIPGCFMRIGAREPGGDAIPAHSPRFTAAESSIFVGAAVLAEAARVASAALAT
jgi:hippurate hydrolase